MLIETFLSKIKTYIKDLTVVTMGVFIALIISNLKENRQARKFHNASIETIKNEVLTNHEILKTVIENQSQLQDTIDKYRNERITLEALFQKANGLQGANFSNTGIDFYSRNEIYSIDFERMAILSRMNALSKLIETKMEKLLDFVYPNTLADTEESKVLLYIYIDNLVESETQLSLLFENYIENYINEKANSK